jgi:glycosyltransferase involved in cell wall biosynthesis
MPEPTEPVELSVVLPCLNEADTLGLCLDKARGAMRDEAIAGELIVADNGSTDGSIDIAQAHGARVVPVAEKGYGSALRAGIASARGEFIIMGDADDSYDFSDIPKFVDRLRQGYDLVQGCRLPAGGGRILDKAMPLSHRWIGNPIFSLMAQMWFRAPIHDVYCGMRGFTKSLYERLDLRCVGMEFATEMIIKASLFGAKITEVPITLHPDGRKSHAPHLKTVRDGWRTLRFFLMLSPRWLFYMPGMVLILLGLIGYAIALPGVQIGSVTFDAHTLLFASLSMLCGYQSVLFAIFTKTYAVNQRLLPEDPRMWLLFRVLNLERGIVLGLVTLIAGAVLLLMAVESWRRAGFGALDYAHTMRMVIPGATLTALGFQTVLSSFLISILGLRRA